MEVANINKSENQSRASKNADANREGYKKKKTCWNNRNSKNGNKKNACGEASVFCREQRLFFVVVVFVVFCVK